jgi:hypothetical protein
LKGSEGIAPVVGDGNNWNNENSIALAATGITATNRHAPFQLEL